MEVFAMTDTHQQFLEAIRAAGLQPPDVIEPGKLYRFPGVGKRNGNTAGWCRLFEDGLGGCFGDWASGLSETWQARRSKPFLAEDRKMPAASPKPALQASKQHEVLSPYGRELWRACRPISGPARAYLEARGCVLPPADGDLRWHPALRHPSGYEGPALVALLTDVIDGTPRTLHRTWIQPDGRKAAVDPPRLLLGGHRKGGAVCRLWPDEDVVLGLGIAEGIETALSLAHAFKPAWAAVDAGNLAALPVLPGVEALTIAADHDPAGIKAARACAERWRAAGREARIAMAGTTGHDLNDEVCHACVA
jgi:phage/plasmid primase-like uncharacterized protein